MTAQIQEKEYASLTLPLNSFGASSRTVLDAEAVFPNQTNLETYSYLSLSIDNNLAPYSWYKLTANFSVVPLKQNGQPDTSVNAVNRTLAVEYNPLAATNNFSDLNYLKIKNTFGIIVNLTSYQILDGATGVQISNSSFAANAFVNMGVKAKRYYAVSQQLPNPIATTTPSTINISWERFAGAQEYELEWTLLDNYGSKGVNSVLSSDLIAFSDRDFELNNTRIATKSTNYEIPLIYSKGILIYRVRAIGRGFDNEFSKIYGNWSSGVTQKLTAADWPHQSIISEHETSKNWQFQASYAEDGKKKEVVSYFDGSLRNRQTVTKVNTDETTVVGEVIYDAQGRAGIEILPTPTTNKNIQYFKKFNVNVANNYYSFKDFDIDLGSCTSEIGGMSNISGSSRYYSQNGYNDFASKTNQAFVPDSRLFPFSQIEYTPDNTGRISRKGGVGFDHKLGSGHEMKYFYTTPNPIELNRLFGYSVGDVSHYKKNIVVDPNGQVSVSYLDPQGRTIATGLSSGKPASLDGLVGESTSTPIVLQDGSTILNTNNHGQLSLDLINKVNLDDPNTNIDNNILEATGDFALNYDKLSLNKQIIVTGNSILHQFSSGLKQPNTFSPQRDNIPANCPDINYPFVYDVKLSLKNDCGTEVLTASTSTTTPVLAYDSDGNLTVPTSVVTTNFSQTPTATISTGAYSLSKEVKINKKAVNDFADHYIKRISTPSTPNVPNICYVDPAGLFSPSTFLPTDCNTTCASCLTSIGTRVLYVQKAFNRLYDPTNANPTVIAVAVSEIMTGGIITSVATLNAGTFTDVLGNVILNSDVQALNVRYNREWELLNIECGRICNPNIISFVPNCLMNEQMLMADFKPNGQYGATNIEITSVNPTTGVTQTTPNINFDKLSIFNSDGKLFYYNTTTGVASTTGNNWNNPLTPYKNEFNELSFVEVTRNELVPPFTYTPPIKPNVTPTGSPSADGITTIYKVEPQQLLLAQDFINKWDDNWALSLLPYHPEYKYFEYSKEICNRTNAFNVPQTNNTTINLNLSSDGYDSYLANTNTYQDAVNRGFINFSTEVGKVQIYTLDPYFKTQPSNSPFEDAALYETRAGATSIMKQAIDTSYLSDGTVNITLYQAALKGVICSPISTCNIPNNLDITSANYSPSERDAVWKTYRSLYIGLKNKIKHIYLNIYALKNKSFNGCIGSTGSNTITDVLSNNFAQKVTLYNYIQANTDANNSLCASSSGSLYQTKQKLFLPADFGYNASIDQTTALNNLVQGNQFEYYAQTGKCPLLLNFDTFLNGFLKDRSTNFTPITNLNNITFNKQYLNPDLFKKIIVPNSGFTVDQIIQAGISQINISTAVSGNILSVNFNGTPNNFSTCPIRIELPTTGANTWSNYGTSSGWKVVNLKQLYYVPNSYNALTGIFKYQVVAEIGPFNNPQNISTGEIILTGETCAPIGGCGISATSVGQVLDPNQATSDQGVGCNKKHKVQQALLAFFNDLKVISTLHPVANFESTSPVILDNYASYKNSFLADFFNENSTLPITTTWTKVGYQYQLKHGLTILATFNMNLPSNFMRFEGVSITQNSTPNDTLILTIRENNGSISTINNSTIFPKQNYDCCPIIDPWANDSDHDGVVNNLDNCPNNANTNQLDTDGNGEGDVCQYVIVDPTCRKDYDCDGILDHIDNCPQIANSNQLDSDGDGAGDACDDVKPCVDDFDCDGVPDEKDNCKEIYNPNQQDSDGDGAGDACDDVKPCVDDFDCDGVPDEKDNCKEIYNPNQEDSDGNGTGDACENKFGCEGDYDCDGVPDEKDNCKEVYNPNQEDSDEDGQGNACDDIKPCEKDADCDGIPDEKDNCPTTPNQSQEDSNGDGVGDACEKDECLNKTACDERTAIKELMFEIGIKKFLTEIVTIIQPQPGTMAVYLNSVNYPALTNFINSSQLKSHFFALRNFTGTSTPNLPIELSKFKIFVSGLNDNIRITFYNNNNILEGGFYFELPTQYNSINNGTNYANKETIFTCFDYIGTGKINVTAVNPGGFINNYNTFFEINGKQVSLCNFLNENWTTSRNGVYNSYSSRSGTAETPCSTCIPQTVVPLTCDSKKADFIDFMNGGGIGNPRILNYSVPASTIADFCGNGYQYISTAYIDYLTKLNVTSLYNVRFITIGEFGQTYLNYGFNGISSVIDLYRNYYLSLNPVGQPENSDTLKWNQWVDTLFRNSPIGKSICPPARLESIVSPPLPVDPVAACAHMVININEAYNQDNYNNYLIAKRNEFIAGYIKKGIETLNEKLTMTYFDQEYQYTLYYYDQAGNLTQTVAPEGVKRFTQAELVAKNNLINAYKVANSPLNANQNADSNLQPSHDFKTQYKYNSLNQLVWQVTPDGGITRFAYDKLGRIIASQNANQIVAIANKSRMSYTTYDVLGRINQAGEIQFGLPNADPGSYSISDEGKLLNCVNGSSFSQPTCNIVDGFDILLSKTEVTRTIYDEDPNVETSVKASNLFITNTSSGFVPAYNNRNRVTGVFYHEQFNANNLLSFDNAILYNYDVHGNVKELINYNSLLKSLPCSPNSIIDNATGQKNDCEKHLKRVVYDYDLISGNVNKVMFQPNKLDQFIHRYNYDADNRIINVETSPDGIIWEKDADYKYYPHGPLSRVEIGNKKVQGTDYAYTLQGWLKAVNGENIETPQNDMGQDGLLNGATKTKDAFGYSLNYYNDDYKAVTNDAGNSGFKPLMISRNAIGATNKDLYNGNIKQMTTNIKKTATEYLPIQKNNYTYDQLNRITAMTSTAILPSVNGIAASSIGYGSTYSYDKNGNIMTMFNTAPGATAGVNNEMDNFKYKYGVDEQGKRTNRLNKVFDSAPNIAMIEDIKNNIVELSTYDINNQNTHNYIYDKIGQLTDDKSEKLKIKWRVDGKVKEIIKNQGLATQSIITFGYDGLGNRISKSVLKNENQVAKTETSFYSKDAQGNTLAVYKLSSNVPNIGIAQTNFNLKEHHLFGSSRIGLEEKDIRLYNQVPIPAVRIAARGAQPPTINPPAVFPFLDYSLNVSNTTMATWPIIAPTNPELENFKFDTNFKLIRPQMNPDGDLLISKLEYKGIKNISSNTFVNLSLFPDASANNCFSVTAPNNNAYTVGRLIGTGCTGFQNGTMPNVYSTGALGELSFNVNKIFVSSNQIGNLFYNTDAVGLMIGGVYYNYMIEQEGQYLYVAIQDGSGNDVPTIAQENDKLSIKRTATTVEFYLNSAAVPLHVVTIPSQQASLRIGLGHKFSKIKNLKISSSININAEITNIVKLAVQKTGSVFKPKLSITQYIRDTGSQVTTIKNIDAYHNQLTGLQLASGLNLTADIDIAALDGIASFNVNGSSQYVNLFNWITENQSTPTAIPAPSSGQIGGTITGYNATKFDMCYFNYNINQTTGTFSNQFNFDLNSGLPLDTPPVATNGTLMTVTPAVVRTLGPCLNDTDQDGLFDIYELNQLTTPLTTIDTDSDGQPNYLDVDDDGDGIKTQFEKADLDLDKSPFTGTAPQNTNPVSASLLYTGNNIPDYLDLDDDGDGYATWETLEGGPGMKNTPTPGSAYTQNSDTNTIPDYLDYSNRSFLAPLQFGTFNYFNLIGDKRYEFSNHLGNVLVVVNDKKLPLFDNNNNLISFNNDILSYSDYYPFGQLVPNRHGSSNQYRYGYNGMEMDDELKGEGNSYDFGERLFDPRIGRFLKLDPFQKSLPFISPYSTSANNPILYIDINGEIFVIPENLTNVQKVKVQFMLDVLKLIQPEVYEYLQNSPIKINVAVGIVDQTGVTPGTVLNGFTSFPSQRKQLEDGDGNWKTKDFKTNLKTAYFADESKYKEQFEASDDPQSQTLLVPEDIANIIAKLRDDQEINVLVEDKPDTDFLSEIGAHEFGHVYFGLLNPAYRFTLEIPNSKGGHIENEKTKETHPDGNYAFKFQMGVEAKKALNPFKENYDEIVKNYKEKLKTAKTEDKILKK